MSVTGSHSSKRHSSSSCGSAAIAGEPNSSAAGRRARPRRIGARDGFIHDAVELDQTDAHVAEFARTSPVLRERAQHQSAKSAVVCPEPRKFDAMSEQGLALRGLPQFKRAPRCLDGALGLSRRQVGLGEISGRLVQIGLECEGTLEVDNGFAGLAPRHQRGAESAVRLGMGGKSVRMCR